MNANELTQTVLQYVAVRKLGALKTDLEAHRETLQERVNDNFKALALIDAELARRNGQADTDDDDDDNEAIVEVPPEVEVEAPVAPARKKRGPGRPRGSGKKARAAAAAAIEDDEPTAFEKSAGVGVKSSADPDDDMPWDELTDSEATDESASDESDDGDFDPVAQRT